jgi:hypothetical protein
MDVLPENIQLDVEVAVSSLLPVKSKHIYEKEYNLFVKWKADNCLAANTEDILLAYFVQKVSYVVPIYLMYYLIHVVFYKYIVTKIQVVISLGAVGIQC